jgi:hypothetical protein
MFYFPEYPGIANGGTADHYAIYSITVFIFQGFMRRVNITVTKYGYLNPGIVFYTGNQRPVGLSFI